MHFVLDRGCVYALCLLLTGLPCPLTRCRGEGDSAPPGVEVLPRPRPLAWVLVLVGGHQGGLVAAGVESVDTGDLGPVLVLHGPRLAQQGQPLALAWQCNGQYLHMTSLD